MVETDEPTAWHLLFKMRADEMQRQCQAVTLVCILWQLCAVIQEASGSFVIQGVCRAPVEHIILQRFPPSSVLSHDNSAGCRTQLLTTTKQESECAPVKAVMESPESVHAEIETANGSRVSPAVINFWLDTLLMLAFVALSITAVIVQFVFPPGVAAKGWLLWGMDFSQWCSIQFGILAVLGFGVVVHVMLHWQWVCGVVVRKLLHQKELPDDGIRTIYGVGLLIALLLTGATIIGIAMLTIQMPPQ